MKYETLEIETIEILLKHLKEHLNESKYPVWFRGQADSTWKLEPKLMRIDNRLPETHYYNRFKQSASFILPSQPKSEFEWLFLMQHYGVPTRLLDWSESPLVALYFAINSEFDKDGSLWVLLPTMLNLISHYKPDYEFEIPSYEDEILKNYEPTIIARERKSSLLPMAAIAPRNSSRMQSQQGVFTISHRENIRIEKAGNEPFDHVWNYIIPAKAKKDLQKDLKLLGFTKFQLFPELDSLSDNF